MAKEALRRGILITFEGIEGCGKSTQSMLLFEYLKKIRLNSVYTREPGGTKLGEAVRRVLLNSNGIRISDLAELFLFEACRAQIVKEIIKPALDKNSMVISDRFSDATVSYQGYGGRVDLTVIKTLDRIATDGVVPDLTILLDIDTAEGLKRARKKGADRMESKDIAYHKRVRAGYLKLAKKNPKRIKVIKVDGAINKVQAHIREEAEIVLRGFKRSR
ncbi:MAG: dTMP kinase [Omnitrophica bacterium RIFCSPLOWO2_02_FULL_45_16]|nr:MAG: dTMP kinase [Omnitrophica bacterium RIFCSPHIGHO2_02_FULL_46_20]OGX00737.1 MAG: dTMP kinase [Omnitrophica bacterium RIFCSPLOWO2_02_FULL_45_16]